MLKKVLFNRVKMLNTLIIVSMLMFCSVFVGNAKIAGIGLTLWVVTVFWNTHLMLNSNNINFRKVVSEIDKKYEIAKVNKKHGEKLLYGITVPMIGIGFAVIILILITLLFIL